MICSGTQIMFVDDDDVSQTQIKRLDTNLSQSRLSGNSTKVIRIGTYNSLAKVQEIADLESSFHTDSALAD
jgi:hypothetical protein